MINITSMNKATQNASIKRERSEDLAKIAQDEYKNSLSWNETDYQNCIKRAKGNANSENNCNNTKRRLDKIALSNLQAALKEADTNLSGIEEITLQESKNKSHVSSVLLTICKISQKKCDNYDDLQFALSIIIFLVIIGTDYLQIAIVLAVNTRKNKKITEKNEEKQEFKPINKERSEDIKINQENKVIIPSETPKIDKIEQKVEPKPVQKEEKIEPKKPLKTHSAKFTFR